MDFYTPCYISFYPNLGVKCNISHSVLSVRLLVNGITQKFHCGSFQSKQKSHGPSII
uniref:Uncharacterized protein n=1 Tax=Anguilla anguilla TaxID=7936 RepID=A0A0E9VRE0_ANGAN